MALIGLETVVRNLNNEINKIKGAALNGLLEGALLIKAEAQKRTPVVTGNLRNSAFVTWKGGVYQDIALGFSELDMYGRPAREKREKERAEVVSQSHSEIEASPNIRVDIGFSAVYAVTVHENPRSGKTGGLSPSGKVYKPGRLPSGRMSTRQVYSTVGGWKFLETAFKENAPRVLQIITEAARIK